MADRMRVTSLMNSRITAAKEARQRQRASPPKEAGGSGQEDSARCQLLVPLMASDTLQVHNALPPCSTRRLTGRLVRRETGEESRMKESHGEGPASHPDPESCGSGRKVSAEA